MTVSGPHAGGGRFGNSQPLPPTTGAPPPRAERRPSEAPPRPHSPASDSAAAAGTKYQMAQQQTGWCLMVQPARAPSKPSPDSKKAAAAHSPNGSQRHPQEQHPVLADAHAGPIRVATICQHRSIRSQRPTHSSRHRRPCFAWPATTDTEPTPPQQPRTPRLRTRTHAYTYTHAHTHKGGMRHHLHRTPGREEAPKEECDHHLHRTPGREEAPKKEGMRSPPPPYSGEGGSAKRGTQHQETR